MVQTFLQCVLGVDSKDLGLFGKTIAYYGTVEQQGRLTLHLHLLLWIQAAFTPQEIRDKLMSEDGAFQKRMVEYLESSHQGEFMKGTSDTVWRDLNERESQPGYVDPLQVLPTSPPEPCSHNADTEAECVTCRERDDWWRQYESTVDEILLKSNMHVCQRGRCFSGDGSCKARFPRDVYSSTMLDPETGALNMKKGESNMNTFSYIMSFLLRCNHNVTSLLSGTALKAVVAYVTEYVTKTGLKTYQIFDVIKSVFDRNDAMHGGTFDRQENARKLMTQVVNALTSKMEMGGPMASMYLLNNPDHYTGHTFVRCWWKNYTRWVMTQWDPLGNDDPMMDDEEDIERVIVRKKGDKYILHSTVDDYQYRPVEFEEVSLYSWVRLMDKSELSAAKKKKQAALDAASADIDIDNISDIDGHESDADSANDASASDHENVATAHVRSTVPQSQGQFIKEHPDKKSHTVKMLEDDGSRVPMFLGGALPRHDHGDREDYCMTMLTLFKPWRTGLDLKAENVNWNDTFASHDFNENALDKMKFFNTKYECLDAKDDYRSQRKATSHGVAFDWMQNDGGRTPMHAFDDEDDFENDLYAEQFLADDTEKSPHEICHERSVKSIKELMMQSGWMDSCIGGLPIIDTTAYTPTTEHTAARWQAIVKSKKEELAALKHKHIPANVGADDDMPSGSTNKVRIVDQEWLQHSFRAADLDVQNMTDELVIEHRLNPEQERAFRTIANHASCKNPERLQMYLGGMGGTGKSEVLKALAKFFERRHESHLFLVVAPTGSAASLLNGTTYHSTFGISDFNDGDRANLRNDAATKARLMGVDYVFVDETSMLSCRDLYLISESACRALGRTDEPFGGLNLIFAGDFAQLPPVNGSPLYSRSVGTQRNPKASLKLQEEAIGKALWHLTTVVVMLTQNMRQLGQSEDDDKLRMALENMRYKACTDDDIAYLKTRVAGRSPTAPKLASKEFRNVPVITAHNLQKDHINLLGSDRFANENGQKITSFYSVDRYRAGTADLTRKPLAQKIEK